MRHVASFFAVAGLLACSGSTRPAEPPPVVVAATAPPLPERTTVNVSSASINYGRHYGKGGEVVEVPLDFTDDTSPTDVTLKGPGVKVVMSAEGTCGRTMASICEMYEGCTIDRPGYVRRVALGHHEAVYELEVTFDAAPENVRIVQHALASWKVPDEDGAWFCAALSSVPASVPTVRTESARAAGEREAPCPDDLPTLRCSRAMESPSACGPEKSTDLSRTKATRRQALARADARVRLKLGSRG
jgi:hypothetical protein